MVQQVHISSDNPGQTAPGQPTVDDQGNLNQPAAEPEGAPQGSEGRPEWLPPNFDTPEAMAEAYKNLQAEHTRASQAAANQRDQEAGSEGEGSEEDGEPGEFNFDSLMAEVYANGEELDAEDYELLAERGYSKAVVDSYLDSISSQEQKLYSEATEAAGGEEQYQAMTQWAQANLPKSAIDAYNRAMDSGDRDQAMLAIQGLKAQYTEANGSRPPRSINGGNSGSGSAGFASMEQQIAAQSDPRYANDPAYRKEVEAKIRNSNFW